jgi:hypothetical protein
MESEDEDKKKKRLEMEKLYKDLEKDIDSGKLRKNKK